MASTPLFIGPALGHRLYKHAGFITSSIGRWFHNWSLGRATFGSG
jgi:hypothetical protein